VYPYLRRDWHRRPEPHIEQCVLDVARGGQGLLSVTPCG
jgi:hypothetical protein